MGGVASYSTVKVVKIQDVPIVAVFFRLLQLAFLSHTIGWDLILNKGYQSFDSSSSTVTTKVKGLGFHNHSFANLTRIFDNADYVIPPNEPNSVFILTNFVETEQTQVVDNNLTPCVDSLTDNETLASLHANDTRDEATRSRNCEPADWRPEEFEEKSLHRNMIRNIDNCTIFIKNDVQFKRFNQRRRNLIDNMTNAYIATCRQDPVHDPYCPTFLLRRILEQAEPSEHERELMLMRGGIVQVEIDWACDLDYAIERCLPRYSFARYDHHATAGFNFRYADFYRDDGVRHRKLVKAYGIRLFILVSGRAGRFDIIPLLNTIGTGIGLLAIADILADFLLLNFTRNKHIYQSVIEFDYRKYLDFFTADRTERL